jgi:hypothetical protein
VCGTFEDSVFTVIDIPEKCIDNSIYLQFQLPSYTISEVTIVGSFYVSQYREPTEEELEFAAIADQLP